MKTPIVIDEAISHFAMGITHNIFNEPVTSYANLAIEALRQMQEKEQNEPLTLDEMNALDHEPIYVLHTGGKWTMNGWHIATASSYQNHGRCDLEIDNGNTTIDMQNYGETWLAYRRPLKGESNGTTDNDK